MNKSERPGGDWSSASESLFEAARADHDASDADRARVRGALAHRLAVEAALAASFAEGARSAARKSALGGNLVRFSLGAAFVSGTLVFMNAYGSRSERPRTVQVSTPVQPALPSSMKEEVKDPEPALAGYELPSPTQAADARPLAVTRSRASAPARVGERAARVRSKIIEKPRESANVPAYEAAQNAQRAAATVSREGSREARDAADLALGRNEAQEQRPSSAASEEGRDDELARASQPSDARAELAFVGKIHAAMRKSDPESALELCAEHERRWPNGTFVQEREGVRAIASCTLRSDDSEARARAFLSAHPRTPLALSVAAACKGAPPHANEAR